MFGAILGFTAGIAAGAAAMAWHYREINRAVERVTARLEHTTKQLHDLQRSADAASGYRRGREEGKKVGAVERFSEGFEGRRLARLVDTSKGATA